MKLKATSFLRDFVPTLLCAAVVTIGMAWWIWSLKPYLDVFLALILALPVPWLGAFIACIAIRRIRPGWPPFLRAFLTSVCGMALFFLLCGSLFSFAEQSVFWLRWARVADFSRVGDFYYSYQGEREERGILEGMVGSGLSGLLRYTLVGWAIGLSTSVVWFPVLAILSLVWTFGWCGGAGVFWQFVNAKDSIQGRGNEKIAILLDSIPFLIVVFLLLMGELWWAIEVWTYLDFAVIEYTFSILPWGLGLMACIALRKRFPEGPRWLRSFLAAVYALLFWFATLGLRRALAEEATHQWRLISRTHLVERLWDGPWWFHADGDEGEGQGLAGIQEYTTFALRFDLHNLPYGLAFILVVCLIIDYVIRLCKFTSKTSST